MEGETSSVYLWKWRERCERYSLANDLHYGIGACGSPPVIPGMRVEALPANTGVITCLANDTGYENIYSEQLIAKERRHIDSAVWEWQFKEYCQSIEAAEKLEMKSVAILAFNGGECKDLADLSFTFQ